MMDCLRHKKQKETEEYEARYAAMTEKERDEQMLESWNKFQSKSEKTKPVDLFGMDLRWTTDEQRVVSLHDNQNWDLDGLLRFVWKHFSNHIKGMAEGTYDKEFNEVNRVVKVIHHKMRTKDTRSICVVPTWLDRETRTHYMTNEDISAIQTSPFTVLERPRLPAYCCDNEVDISTMSYSSSTGSTTDESF
jgi:glutamate synthase domain-containing protein 3